MNESGKLKFMQVFLLCNNAPHIIWKGMHGLS